VRPPSLRPAGDTRPPSLAIHRGRRDGRAARSLHRGGLGRASRSHQEVASTAGSYVTHNPPGGFTRHLPGRVHTLDPQSNVGYPPGEVVVDVSLNGPPSKRILGFLKLETKRVLGVSRRSLRLRDYRPHDSSDDHSQHQDPCTTDSPPQTPRAHMRRWDREAERLQIGGGDNVRQKIP